MIDSLVGQGMLPDPVLRFGINRLIKQRLKDISKRTVDEEESYREALIKELKSSPIAIEVDLANDQHYQVPTDFFHYVLGKNKKYSCCLWDKAKNLDESEDEMLELTTERADIKDGMKILELGCGWGAITLFMAKKYPHSEITAISNSSTQRKYIESLAEKRGLKNIKIITANIAEYEMNETFDRVVSIEMFEHMRNYKLLLGKISRWLNPGGKLFVHVFTHKEKTYKYEVQDDSDWMSKYFFSGGIMPGQHLFYYFQDDLKVIKHWNLSGRHYEKTARAWLEKMDSNKKPIMKIFEDHYGKEEAKKWWNYWRVFFMSCEQLWAFKNGNEWNVTHYLFEK